MDPPPYRAFPSPFAPETQRTENKAGSNETKDKTLKFVVGLDFGTTNSGLSYVTSDRSSVTDIIVVNDWHCTSGVASKAPSLIAYPFENEDLDEIEWGFGITTDLISYSWTKLLFGKDSRVTQSMICELQNKYYGQGFCTVPEGKSAKQVVTDYLKCLYTHLVNTIASRGGKYSALWQVTPAEFWITVPAIWSDAAKNATFEAATMAGFGSRRIDQERKDSVHIITEPEAAALTVLTPRAGPEAVTGLDNGPKNVLVCDCGGGTVDIVTYKVSLNANGQTEFEELLVGEGAMCGSTKIDRNFHDWMSRTFGESYRSLSPDIKNPSSKFFRSFERSKKAFTGPNHRRPPMEAFPITMNAPDSRNYDKENRTVLLKTQDMLELFQPAVTEILALVDTQVSAAERKGSRIEQLFLVGGFGESPYLRAELSKWCAEHNIEYSNPVSCQEAIVKGAALRGLLGLQPLKRMSPRHYGYSISMRFREGIDDEDYSWTCPWERTKWCHNRMEWFIRKGDCLDEIRPKRFELQRSVFADSMTLTGTINIWTCERDFAPDSSQSWSVRKLGAVRVTFSRNDIERSPSKVVDGDQLYQVLYEIEVDLVSERGLLEFRTIIHGNTKNNTSIRYDEGFDTIVRPPPPPSSYIYTGPIYSMLSVPVRPVRVKPTDQFVRRL